jgi:rod shape-determining protein MreB and related proteins
MFRADLYVQISVDRIEVRNVRSGRSYVEVADPGFSTPRLLIGQFTLAQELLRRVVAGALGWWPFRLRRFVMHPLERIEGGLSQIEERVLLELAAAAGSRRTVVWIGESLSDADVRAILQAPTRARPR